MPNNLKGGPMNSDPNVERGLILSYPELSFVIPPSSIVNVLLT